MAKRVLNTHPSLALEAYSGKYVNKIYGNAEITFVNNILTVKQPNNFNFPLQHWNYDTFMGSSINWWWGKSIVQFSLNSEGQVAGFSIDGIAYSKEKK